MRPNDLPQTFHRSSLGGKVAVVTGGTQGLGEATLRLFKERGCRGLVITGRNEERGMRLANELSSDSCEAIFVRADLEKLNDVRNILKVTDETFGTLDILVNAAATTDRGSLWDTTPEDYDRIMNVNTRAPFFLTQDAARIMEREQVAGSIINISSTASYGSMPMLATYGMSKGALNVATKNAAYSLMWSKIRVNALAIGWMDTPGEDAIQRRLHSGNGHQWKEAGEANQPFGRLLQADEVARSIAFCASEESGMMTGCVIDFDQSVWGAGDAPVPPRKDQWARANGMTFSFESNKDDSLVKTRASSKPASPSSFRKSPRSSPKSSPSTTRRKKSGQPATNTRLPRASQKPESSSDSSTANPSFSASEGSGVKAGSSDSNRTQAEVRDPTRAVPKLPFMPSPKTPSKAKSTIQTHLPVSSRWSPISPLTPDASVSKSSLKKIEHDSDKEKGESTPKQEKNGKHTGSSLAIPLLPPSSKDSAPRKPNPTDSPPRKPNPADEPYPDEDRPDPAQFRLILRSQEESHTLDDYLPDQQDLSIGSQQRKERAQKKYGSSHGEDHPPLSPTWSPKSPNTRPPKSPYYGRSPKQTRPDKATEEKDDHRAMKVEGWLNSGKTQRRSWRVKQVREVHG